MSFLTAKTHFEEALARAQIAQDKAVEECITKGLLDLTQAMKRGLGDIEDRLKTVEQRVNALR